MASSYPQRRSPSGRFLPPEPRTAEPYRFTPQLALRVGVLAALALIVFAILFLRLWALQVLSGDRYLNAAQNNQLRTIRVEAQRGSIVDRAGRTIVSNVPGTAVLTRIGVSGSSLLASRARVSFGIGTRRILESFLNMA